MMEAKTMMATLPHQVVNEESSVLGVYRHPAVIGQSHPKATMEGASFPLNYLEAILIKSQN